MEKIPKIRRVPVRSLRLDTLYDFLTIVGRSKHMSDPKRPYTKILKETMSRKSEILSKAQALWEVGMEETAQPLWLSAATYEEHIAPMLDALGRSLEGAIHRISAASCYEKAEDPSRAVNLYHAALSGPLCDDTRREVENMMNACLVTLDQQPAKSLELS